MLNDTPANSKLITYALVAAVCVVAAQNAWVADDAYISFKVADNLAAGQGLRFNIDERVQVFTNPLWTILVGLAHAVTGEMYLTNIGLSLAALGVTLATWTRTLKIHTPALAIVLTTLLFSKSFMDYSTSGMENSLAHLLGVVFLSTFFADRIPLNKKLYYCLLISSLAAFNRLDHCLLYIPPVALLTFQARSQAKPLAFASAASPVLLWLAFSVFYYGFPFPNTAYAKLNTDLSMTWRVEHGVFYRGCPAGG